MMTYYTIGNMRDDGDMEVVATINMEMLAIIVMN